MTTILLAVAIFIASYILVAIATGRRLRRRQPPAAPPAHPRRREVQGAWDQAGEQVDHTVFPPL
jgi:hypothetical protein